MTLAVDIVEETPKGETRDIGGENLDTGGKSPTPGDVGDKPKAAGTTSPGAESSVKVIPSIAAQRLNSLLLVETGSKFLV